MKKSLNSGGQQFHQYQQKEQPPLISNHCTWKRAQHNVGNPGPGLEQAHKCGSV
jgi:hypothetical protein